MYPFIVRPVSHNSHAPRYVSSVPLSYYVMCQHLCTCISSRYVIWIVWCETGYFCHLLFWFLALHSVRPFRYYFVLYYYTRFCSPWHVVAAPERQDSPCRSFPGQYGRKTVNFANLRKPEREASLWLVRPSGITCRTACRILILAGTVSA